MKNIRCNQLLFLSGLFVLLFSVTSCDNNEKTTNPVINEEEHPEYVPGQVLVSPVDSLSFESFDIFIGELGLSILIRHDYDRVIFWIEVPSDIDSISHYITLLSSEYQLFSGVRTHDYSFDDVDSTKNYLWAHYKYGLDASDTSEGEALITILGLVLKRIEIRPFPQEFRHYTIAVPIGEELYWVEIIKSYSFIDSAEPNYYLWGGI